MYDGLEVKPSADGRRVVIWLAGNGWELSTNMARDFIDEILEVVHVVEESNG